MKFIVAAFAACTIMTGVGAAQAPSGLTFEGAGGVAIPAGSAKDRLKTGYNFLLGAGWKLSPNFAGMLEFQYDRFALTTGTLQAFNQPDGFNRFWSLSVSPRYYIHPTGRLGAYGTGGFGIYSRTLAFTDPSQATGYCDPYYGCSSTGAPIVASATNYRGGFNIGGGLTYAIGQSGFKAVSDIRYNRFLSHANNEFVTLSFGIVF